MGAWIEILLASMKPSDGAMSLPSWERGLKSFEECKGRRELDVAPFVGAWIEIVIFTVDPPSTKLSLPSWERGLK